MTQRVEWLNNGKEERDMKTPKWTRRIIIVLIPLSLLLSPCAMAQIPHEQQAYGATMPATTFHSTGSAMMSTGSAYSANPIINSDGTASMSGASYAPTKGAGSGPRKVNAFDDDSEDMPVGDAVVPLLLMAFAFAAYIRLRERRITRK